MKLLYCPSCGDLVQLRSRERRCVCGECAGKYLSDVPGETRAVVSGRRVQVVGLDSQRFLKVMIGALNAKPDPPSQARDDYYLRANTLDAWVFGPNALALTKRGHDEVTKV